MAIPLARPAIGTAALRYLSATFARTILARAEIALAIFRASALTTASPAAKTWLTARCGLALRLPRWCGLSSATPCHLAFAGGSGDGSALRAGWARLSAATTATAARLIATWRNARTDAAWCRGVRRTRHGIGRKSGWRRRHGVLRWRRFAFGGQGWAGCRSVCSWRTVRPRPLATTAATTAFAWLIAGWRFARERSAGRCTIRQDQSLAMKRGGGLIGCSLGGACGMRSGRVGGRHFLGAVVARRRYRRCFVRRRHNFLDPASDRTRSGRPNLRTSPRKPRRRGLARQCAISRSVGRQASVCFSRRSTIELMISTNPVATTMPANTPTVSDSSRACSM